MLRGVAVPRTRDVSAQGPQPELIETKADCAGSGAAESQHDNDRPVLTFDPSHLQTPRLVLSTVDGETATATNQHRRHQTAPDAASLNFNAQARAAPSASPHPRHPVDMPLTGDGRGRRGSLASVRTCPADATIRSRRGLAPMDPTSRNTPTGSRFGFISNWFTQSPTSPRFSEDDLLELDVEAALYPAGAPSDRDAFSPAAFKNLHVNATGLVVQMQEAYRRRTIEIRDMQAEQEAEKEEAQEKETRFEHTKRQLAQMAAIVAEKDQALQSLMLELKAEKKARHDEGISREKLLGVGSMITEDLGVDEEERKKWRKSGGTEKSDISLDTDQESVEVESIFSHDGASPTVITSATESVVDLSAITPLHGKAATLGIPPKIRSVREMSTLQKLMKGISGETVKEEADGAGRHGCKNCQGQDASMAWDTVSLLRDENKGLKHRVAQLENGVECALDLVNGIGL